MSYIVNSIPKSGTYLLEKFLGNCGVPASGLHFRNDRVWLFKGESLDDIISNESQFRVFEPLSQSINRLGTGESAVAHFFDPQDCLPLFEQKGIRTIFLVRDLRHCLVSQMRFLANPKRAGRQKWLRPGQPPQQQFVAYLEDTGIDYFAGMERQLEWLETDTPVVRFEDLIGDHGSEKQESAVGTITSTFDIGISKTEALEALAKAVGTPTRTYSGQRSSLDEFLSPTANSILKEIGVLAANRRIRHKVSGPGRLLSRVMSAIRGS